MKPSGFVQREKNTDSNMVFKMLSCNIKYMIYSKACYITGMVLKVYVALTF